MLYVLVEAYSVTQAVQRFGCSGKGFFPRVQEKKVSAGVMVLFTPAPLLQCAGGMLLGVTFRECLAQSSLINAVLLKKS